MKKTLLVIGLAAAMPQAFADKLPVVASFSILGDVVREVGGDRVEVRTLVGPDQDAHVYQPRPQDVKALAASRLFVVNGLGFEGWMGRMSKSAGYKGATVVATAGLKPMRSAAGHEHDHEHGEVDPHVWNNPLNVQAWVKNISAALVKVDPAGKAYYEQRAVAYDRKLVELDAWAQKEVGRIAPDKRRVISSHDAFGYLAQRYQIRFSSPQGMNTEAEASARGVANLIRQIRQSGTRAVFVENISDRRMIDRIAKESGAEVSGKLYSDALSNDGAATTYVDLMRHNISQLVIGMQRN